MTIMELLCDERISGVHVGLHGCWISFDPVNQEWLVFRGKNNDCKLVLSTEFEVLAVDKLLELTGEKVMRF